MLDPQVIVDLLQQRGHQSASLNGTGGWHNFFCFSYRFFFPVLAVPNPSVPTFESSM